ncbi:Oligopeptidase F [Seminavis robusta]|uniref:Oligopeptidase F n=1 Tax=Seminavis robusta TaxID=568900 RepID=A0A9N8ENB7_9STRA|nr:Oligopeptidase F [Seminavis robusta]|eukprot:Sro1381_g267850.1 Oligopeptidase F (160) ;mRNA; r:19243-19722
MPPLGEDAAVPEDLPRWELSERFGFSGPTDPALDKYVEETATLSKAFHEKYEGKLKDVSLKQVISEYEQISIRRGTVGSYLSLEYDTQLDNDEVKKRKDALGQLQSQTYGDHLEWFSLDLAAMEEADLQVQYEKDPSLKEYKAYIDEERRFKPHNLAKE